MGNRIDVQIGIYNTVARIIRHSDGTVTIKAPYIDWNNNTGTLAFEVIRLSGKDAVKASRVFNYEQMVTDMNGNEYPMSYSEMMDGLTA